MTTAQTVHRLLLDAAGEPLCESCLAFACSVSLSEMRQVTDTLLSTASFQRRDRCISCGRPGPAIAFALKCIHCSRPVLRGEPGLKIDGDMFHAACLRLLSSNENIRISWELSRQSRRLIEEARRRLRPRRVADLRRSGVRSAPSSMLAEIEDARSG